MVVRSPEQLAQRFREANRKVTPQRMAVFETLGMRSGGHCTAEQIHRSVTDKLPNVSLRTVYQILHELTDLGELVMLDLGTGAVRYDHNLASHHHLVCNECGAVVDIATHMAEVQLAGVAGLGVSVSSAEVVLRGTCPQCTPETVDPDHNSQQQPMTQIGDPHA